MTRRAVPVLFLLASSALAACELPILGLYRWERVPGMIDIAPIGGPDPWSAPDTVVARTPFHLQVVTWGSSSCTRPSDSEVRITDLVAEIRVFDEERGGDCHSDLRAYPRTVSLAFGRAGDAMIRAHGVDLQGRPVTREIPVVVR